MEIILVFSLLALTMAMMMRIMVTMEMMAIPARVKVLAANRRKTP